MSMVEQPFMEVRKLKGTSIRSCETCIEERRGLTNVTKPRYSKRRGEYPQRKCYELYTNKKNGHISSYNRPGYRFSYRRNLTATL